MSLKNYKFEIAYDGSRYYGWEHQPDQDTVQGRLETVLEKMAGTPVELIGAGRTDAGVHARAMVANARMDVRMTPENIRDYMNRYLPDDICVNDVREAAEGFHARYNAVGKTYRYSCYIGKLKPVFTRKYLHVLDFEPDVDAMRQAAEYLTGEHDFKSFCGNPRMKKSTVRTVDKIEINRRRDTLTIEVHGNGFLQNMVRILSGTLLEVGAGKRAPGDMPGILMAKDRTAAGFTAPAKGLCLMKVDY